MESSTQLQRYDITKTIAGCDEAGRGCLAGPVAAAAVILPADFSHPALNDSKQLTSRQREDLRTVIENAAVAFNVSFIPNTTIDRINILQASIQAMHNAISQLTITPGLILVDGNYFKAFKNIPHQCVTKGDSKYISIAAASVLAKTYRDKHMARLHEKFPQYEWAKNKGYATKKHREAIQKFGSAPYHRLSYKTFSSQQNIQFPEDTN